MGCCMSCPYCKLSWKTLKEMKERKIKFPTAGGRKSLLIAELKENPRAIKMQRSTGRLTWWLSYEKLKRVHDDVHCGKVILDPYEIDKIVPTWGNYIVGLLRYLGCRKIETCY